MPMYVEIDKSQLISAFDSLAHEEIVAVINAVVDNHACVELDEMILVRMWKNVLAAYDADDTPSFGDLVRQYKDQV